MTDIVKQIRLVESQDTKVSEDARQALSLQVTLGNGIPQLVAYYAEHRSERALDLLCKIKEPYDRVLLDTLVETVKEKKCQETLILLGQIVQQAPSWTPKIAMHPLFKQILEHIKKTPIVSDCISGLLFVSLLLPHCSGLNSNHLLVMFTTFIACGDLYRKKMRDIEKKRLVTNHVERVNVSHLAFAIREYFQTLYGIYPGNFLHFLRTTFASDPKIGDRHKLIPSVIIPLIHGVRLHPNLVLSTKDKEISKERWAHKEAHDFLDDCRRVIIGLIPIPTTSDADKESEPDSPSAIPHSTFSQLFHTENSSSSSNLGWNEAWAETESRSALLESINTPPGSVSGTPTHKRSTIDEDVNPIVITSEEKAKRRRSTGGGGSGHEGRQSSGGFRQSISNMFKRTIDKRQVQPEPLIEILPGEEDTRRISENAEEAEEAMDCITPIEEPLISIRPVEATPPPPPEDPTPSTSSPLPTVRSDRRLQLLASTWREHPKETVPTTSISSATEQGTSEPPNEQEIGRLESIRLQEAVQAVRAARDRVASAELDENAVVRSRSTSFLFGPNNGSEDRDRTSTMDTGILERAEASEHGDHGGNDSIDGGRSRFSVTSYFSRLNRQRFVSECPALDADQIVDFEMKQTLGRSTPTHTSKTLNRTSSCPNLAGEELAPAVQVRANVESKGVAAKIISPVEQFPYLKLIEPLGAKFYEQLEGRLESNHEVHREQYMGASLEFHQCLRELGLADRLPGKIYDDMAHITAGLTVEKQRDILRTRLQLVNQHLLYERSCRLLHANRNRRLFGKIKQQRVTDAELVTLKENLHETMMERSHLRKALSDMRRQMDQQKRVNEASNAHLFDAMKRYKEEYHELQSEFEEMRQAAVSAEAKERIWRVQIDGYCRRAEDAEANLRLHEQKMEVLKGQTSELKRAHTENQQMKDQMAISDFRRDDDRLRSPDNDDRDRIIKQLQNELEKVRLEREKERIVREELRERLQETEISFKQESTRSSELKIILDRSSRLLREQNEAAEQKFLSLQAVNQLQETHIFDLLANLDEANGKVAELTSSARKVDDPEVEIPRSSLPHELSSNDGSGCSEHHASRFAPSRSSQLLHSSRASEENDLTAEDD